MNISKPSQEALVETFIDLGLRKSEIEVFLCLLGYETAQRASPLAKQTKIKRTTLYGILNALLNRGLITSVEERGVLAYRSIQPHLLVDYIERAREKLSTDISKVKDVVPLIEQARAKRIRRFPSMQFFEGLEGIKQAYEDTLKDNENKALYAFTGTEAIYNVMGQEWVKNYLARRSKSDVKAYVIAPDTPMTEEVIKRDSKEARVTKVMPPGYHYDIELIAHDNKVLISSLTHDHPLAVLIEDEKIAALMKELFRFVDNALPLPKKPTESA